MLSTPEAISYIAIVVLFVAVPAVAIANLLFKRELHYLLFSTSIIGTLAYFLFFFAFLFSIGPIVRFLLGSHAEVSVDFMKYVLVLPAVPAVFCMVAWQVLVHQRRNKKHE